MKPSERIKEIAKVLDVSVDDDASRLWKYGTTDLVACAIMTYLDEAYERRYEPEIT